MYIDPGSHPPGRIATGDVMRFEIIVGVIRGILPDAHKYSIPPLRTFILHNWGISIDCFNVRRETGVLFIVTHRSVYLISR
jgi:hypothetical protein